MGSNKDYRNEGWLREKYHGEGHTLKEMGDMCGVSRPTIADWMDKHDIPRRDNRAAQRVDGKHTDRKWLIEQYHDKRRTLQDIAEECDVDRVTVMNWMDRHDIPRREAYKHKRTSPAQFTTEDSGYERVAVKSDGEFIQVRVHQLVAIANGADPHKVFSDGDYQCHHINGVPWDNRAINVELLEAGEHQDRHWPMRDRADTGEFL